MGTGICPKDWLLQMGCWWVPLGQPYLSELRRAGIPPDVKNGVSFCWSVCSIMQPPWGGKSTKGAPELCNPRWLKWWPLSTPPSGPFRVHICRDLEGCQEGLLGGICNSSQCAPPWHIARAGIQSGPWSARLTSWGRGFPHRWDQSSSAELQEAEVAKHPREDPLTRWSKSRRWHSYSTSWNHLQWHWNLMPQPQSRFQSPSSSPPRSHPADEQLSCSFGDLCLHPRPWELQRRVWRGDAPTHTKEHPPQQEPMKECTLNDQKKKQVSFDVREDLGSDHTMPMELTTSFAGGTAKEQDNTPGTSTPLSVDLPSLCARAQLISQCVDAGQLNI